MSAEILNIVGRLGGVALTSSVFGFAISFLKYNIRRRAFLLSRARALQLANELPEQTIKNFVRLSPHFRAEDLRFDEPRASKAANKE